MKIRTKLTFILCVLAAFNILGMGTFTYYAQKHNLADRIREEKTDTLNKFVQVCSESVISQNEIALANYIHTLKNQPGFISAMFLDQNGKALGHSDESQLYRKVAPPIDPKVLKRDEVFQKGELTEGKGMKLILAQKVGFGDKLFGAAMLVYDSSVLLKRLKSILYRDTRNLLLIGMFMLGLAALAAVGVARSLARPIQTLTVGTQKIGQGQLDWRISVKGKDELGQLSQGFNEMAVKLQEVDRLKEDFISNVTHELRSPLTGIRGFAELLSMGQEGSLNETQQHYCEIILQNAQRLGRFVDNILDVAKLEAGLVEFPKECVSVAGAAAEIKELFEPVAKKQKVKLEMTVPEHLNIMGDSDSLKQVFSNLVSNALKFTPENGKITIWAACKPEGNFPQIGVSDTGVGIAKEDIPKLFNKFAQVKEAQKGAQGKGTGLGLTIVKKIIEGQGGRIWIESEPGKGTSFIFTLPGAAKTEKHAETHSGS